MQLRKLFLWFYRLNMADAVLLLLCGTEAFRRIAKKAGGQRWWRVTVAALLTVLLAAVSFATVLNRSGGGAVSVNLIPFHSYRAVAGGANPELYRSNFMNAALFYPAGVLLTALLPEKWRKRTGVLLTVLFFAGLSGGIEYLQYRLALGQCEIDDVIHNTLGALLGSLGMLALPDVPGLLIRAYLRYKKLCIRGAERLWEKINGCNDEHISGDPQGGAG